MLQNQRKRVFQEWNGQRGQVQSQETQGLKFYKHGSHHRPSPEWCRGWDCSKEVHKVGRFGKWRKIEEEVMVKCNNRKERKIGPRGLLS